MRFGLVIYGSLGTLSGGYLYDRTLVEYLQDHGDQVALVSLPWRAYLRHLGDNYAPDLARRLRTLDVDVLIQDELNHPSLFDLNRRIKSQVPYPIVSIVHHLRCSEPRRAWLNRFYRLIERRYLLSVDGFIFNSRTTRGVVEALVGAERPAVVAYPGGDRLASGISAPQIEGRAQQAGPLRVLFLGNVVPRKGLHVLLEALAGLPRVAWCLTVVGSLDMAPRYARRLQALVARRGLQDQVQFQGPLDEYVLVSCFQQHHVLALPSLYEGFGIAYLEAMAFGLPAIASTAGAAREIITHGLDGFLVPPGDSRQLGRVLHALHLDRRLLAAMGVAARQRYERHSTWEQSARRIQAFLHNFGCISVLG